MTCDALGCPEEVSDDELPKRPVRYAPKTQEELHRLHEENKIIKEAPEPQSGEVPAEEALWALVKRDPLGIDLDIEECIPLSEELKSEIDALAQARGVRGHVGIGILVVWYTWEECGLPRALQVRPPRVPEVVTLHRPTAPELWRYVLRNQPVVIRGALDEVGFPPLVNFSDFDYLRDRCGSRMIKVKANLFHDRDGREIFISDPNVEIPFSMYLDRLEEADQTNCTPGAYAGKLRLADFLPEMVEDLDNCSAGPMQQFSSVLGPLKGKQPHTYFGGGNNTTALHCDPSENILVVISGMKTFELFPPTDVDVIYPSRPPAYLRGTVPPFTDPQGMDEETSERYPLFRHASPQIVDLYPGDMLYLPIFWWHNVAGSLEPNMILNWWAEIHARKGEPGDGIGGCGPAMTMLNEIQQSQDFSKEMQEALGVHVNPVPGIDPIVT